MAFSLFGKSFGKPGKSAFGGSKAQSSIGKVSRPTYSPFAKAPGKSMTFRPSTPQQTANLSRSLNTPTGAGTQRSSSRTPTASLFKGISKSLSPQSFNPSLLQSMRDAGSRQSRPGQGMNVPWNTNRGTSSGYNPFSALGGGNSMDAPMQDAVQQPSNLDIRGGSSTVDYTNPQAMANRTAQEKAMGGVLAGDAVGGAMTESDQRDFTDPQDFLDARAEALAADPEFDQTGGNDLQDQIDELMNQENPYQDDYQKLLEEENRIKDESQRAIQEISGQAIPYQFIQGQGARVQNMADVDLGRVAGQQQTLQQKIADEQRKRQMMVETLQNRYNQQQQGQRDASERAYKERTRAEDRAFEMMKFNEDKRRYGQDYALRAQSARQSGSSSKYSTYTGKNIPGSLKSDLVTDISSRGGRRGRGKPNFTKGQLYSAYPEVDTDYIDSLYDSLS